MHSSGVVLREINQKFDSSFSDLGGTGGLFTVQGAYDYQIAPRWVVGALVDAEWSDISAHSKQSSNSGITFSLSGPCKLPDDPVGTFSTSNGAIDTEVNTDWGVSVGGRIGWLANEQTLLYFLAAYTHADLSDAAGEDQHSRSQRSRRRGNGRRARNQSIPQQPI